MHLEEGGVRRALGVLLVCLVKTSAAKAAQGEDLDVYKWRVAALWWFSNPTGTFTGKANSGSFDLHRDFGFGSYSTFSGSIDWRFKRKHHLIFGVSPVVSSRTTTLQRTIEFQGVVYDVDTKVSADIKSFAFAPGYQYDIIRRNHISVSFATQVNLLNTSADLSGTVSANGQSETRKASGSIFAPLPTLGARVRWYPAHSSRLALDGSFQGMSFFGYGNFMSARSTANIAMSRVWRLNLGYQMGTRLRIDTGTNDIGIRLTQKGPVAGVEASW